MPQPGGSGTRSLVQRGQPPPTPPTPSHPTQRGQLSYAGLTASVCCVLAVCLDSPALLSQQLNNRWLKKASIQSGLDQKITPRKVHRLQTKHTHITSTHMQITWIVRVAHAANGRTANKVLQTVISFAHKNAHRTHSDETHATTCK